MFKAVLTRFFHATALFSCHLIPHVPPNLRFSGSLHKTTLVMLTACDLYPSLWYTVQVTFFYDHAYAAKKTQPCKLEKNVWRSCWRNWILVIESEVYAFVLWFIMQSINLVINDASCSSCRPGSFPTTNQSTCTHGSGSQKEQILCCRSGRP